MVISKAFKLGYIIIIPFPCAFGYRFGYSIESGFKKGSLWLSVGLLVEDYFEFRIEIGVTNKEEVFDRQGME